MGLAKKENVLRFTYSENISTTFRAGSFYCWSSILKFSYLWIFDFSFVSTFYTICCCHYNKPQTALYLWSRCEIFL